mgnify:CR=1 FL=1
MQVIHMPLTRLCFLSSQGIDGVGEHCDYQTLIIWNVTQHVYLLMTIDAWSYPKVTVIEYDHIEKGSLVHIPTPCGQLNINHSVLFLHFHTIKPLFEYTNKMI